MSALSSALSESRSGDASKSASIIEVLALDQLMPSLRLAFHYVLTVAAQRHPSIFLRLHGRRDEVYLAFAAVLEAHSLAVQGGSFAESFYSLQREPAAAGRSASSRLALLLLLLPPYLRSKIEERAGAPDEDGAQEDAADGAEGADARSPSAGNRPASRGPTDRLVWRVLRLLSRVVCASLDAGNLLQLLLYTYGRSKYATLAQRLLGYTLRHSTPNAAPSPLSCAGADGDGRAPMPPPVRGAPLTTRGEVGSLERLATLAEMPLRHARHLLLLSVFGYRLLEWWHAPDHAPLPPPKLIPPPPPPPVLTSSSAGLLAKGGGRRVDGSATMAFAAADLCAACRMLPHEPTAAPSGFVFCAACANAAIRRNGRCPVTGMPMRPEDLRRLFETSRPPAAT